MNNFSQSEITYTPLHHNRVSKPTSETHRRIIFWWAVVTATATLGLIFFGGQVKSHEAGLSVPDWPLTYGENPITFPYSKWVGGIWFEHSHRLFAMAVALLSLGLTVLLLLWEKRVWVKGLGLLAFGAVLFQAFLGGMTVWYQLPLLVSTAHGMLAQAFLVLCVWIAYGTSKEHEEKQQRPAAEYASAHYRLAVAFVVLLFVQLFLGALVRHSESALAVPDFPKTGGQWWPIITSASLEWINAWRFENTDALGHTLPDVTAAQAWVHLLHRYGAALILLFTLWILRRTLSYPVPAANVRPVVFGMVLLVALQIALGVFTVWSHRHPLFATLHVTVGAALLASAALYAARVKPPQPNLVQETVASTSSPLPKTPSSVSIAP
jgi:cytochrome c oxidase assembly protein subunit 15